MKKLVLILSLLLLTACASAPENGREVTSDNSTGDSLKMGPDTAEVELSQDIMNFRTSDTEELKNENRVIKTYEEFEDYINDYAILDNPFFIDEESLNKLQKVDEAYFEKQGFVAVVLVVSSGSTKVSGENYIVKNEIIETFISSIEAQMGTTDIATRHVLFVVDKEDLDKITEVKVTFSLK